MCCGQSAKPSKYGTSFPKAQAKVIQMPTAQEIMNQTAISNAVRQSGAQARSLNVLNQKRQVYR